MTLYKISAFSRLGQVSIKALRLYDQRGLLKPAKVNPENGYRYYSAEQLCDLHRLLALKAMGFSLEQIAQLMSDNISLQQLQSLLKARRHELQQQLVSTQVSITTVESYLNQIEGEQTMTTYDIVLKSTDAIGPVLSCRDTLPAYTAVSNLFQEMMGYMAQKQIVPNGYTATIWHNPEYQETNIDGEAIMAISTPISDTARFKTVTLPAQETVASVMHNGSYATLNQPYAAIMQWIEDNGYAVTGPNREIYHKGGADQNDSSYITEIQFPVSKL